MATAASAAGCTADAPVTAIPAEAAGRGPRGRDAGARCDALLLLLKDRARRNPGGFQGINFVDRGTFDALQR